MSWVGARLRSHPLGVGLQSWGSGRAVESRRRDLFQDGRGGSAAHPAFPGRDDRLRRPAARHLPAPPAVGHVPPGARTLQSRSRPVLARRSGVPDDGSAGARLRPHRSVERSGPAPMPTSCFSTRARSRTKRTSAPPPARPAGSTRSSSTARRSGAAASGPARSPVESCGAAPQRAERAPSDSRNGVAGRGGFRSRIFQYHRHRFEA